MLLTYQLQLQMLQQIQTTFEMQGQMGMLIDPIRESFMTALEQGDVDRFIETYMEYVLKDEDLASTFKAAVKKQLAKDVEKIDE